MVEATISEMNPSTNDFAVMFEENMLSKNIAEGQVITGVVIGIENDLAIVDVGLKTEGRIPLKEFYTPGSVDKLEVGAEVEVYLDRIDNALGEAVLSREKARREESWTRHEKSYADGEKVEGVIFGRVKGGFTVDLDGAVAFLPGSQVDVRPIRDIGPLLNTPQSFQILKMDKRRGNIVVSRRAVLEETRAEQRHELVQNLAEGQVIEGVVKNITDYGAFVDLGGIDGLLHVTDIAWRRVNHPTDILTIGQTVKVQIIKINPETQRISLGMKQLESDPWDGVDAKFPLEGLFRGVVTNITDYGAFVELEPGVEGLVHVSEMSWTKKNIHPGKIVSTSQEVEVMVLEVDPTKRRISLGLKQCFDNPWTAFAATHPVGSVVEGEVKNTTEFGIFIGLENDVDGMIYLSDLDWNRPGEELIGDYHKGTVVKAKVIDIDPEKERISLGVKQLDEDPYEALDQLKRGEVVTCTVKDVRDGGIEVTIGEEGVSAVIRRADLSRDRSEQRPDRFAVGDLVDARVTQIDRPNRKVNLSIKALEIAEEKDAIAQYGSANSGASLGDILGEMLNKAQAEQDSEAADKNLDDAAQEESVADASSVKDASAEDLEEADAPEEAAADVPGEADESPDDAVQEESVVEESSAEDEAGGDADKAT